MPQLPYNCFSPDICSPLLDVLNYISVSILKVYIPEMILGKQIIGYVCCKCCAPACC